MDIATPKKTFKFDAWYLYIPYMSKISFEEIFARNQTIKFYKYEKNREIDEKIMIYELKSLVSIVYTNLLL